jgi:hypothetical protein
MSKVSEVAGVPGVDPTMPRVPLKIGKETLYLCFTLEAIARAQSILRANGFECSLIQALDFSTLQADNIVPLLYAGLITHKPEITLEEIFKIVKFRHIPKVLEAIVLAYGESMAEPDEDADPVDPNEPE